MTVLLLRLAAPLQSWGLASRHLTRSTATTPTKSGVIGMLASALGRPRDADISDLAALRFGVRTDQPGQLLTDYHTVSAASHSADRAGQRMPTADGSTLAPAASTKVTRRHYLTDAVFVAALQGHPDTLTALADALRRPRHPLYLGRRSCPPSRPVLLGITDDPTLEDALAAAAWQAGPAELRRHRHGHHQHVELDVTIDAHTGGDTLPDQPQPGRHFTGRVVTHHTVLIPVPDTTDRPADPHDPMALLDDPCT